MCKFKIRSILRIVKHTSNRTVQVNKLLSTNKIVVLLVVFVFYVLFPTNNSSLDAYAYAGYVEYNSSFLFKPHHLLSHAFIYWIVYPLKALGIGIDVLLFGKIINAIFQVVNLAIFYKIITLLNIERRLKLLYILTIAFSFNIWQYTTENEVYIIPITCSLLGSLYLLKSIHQYKSSYIVLSGFFAALACLFHQLHFFWWLGLLIGFSLYYKKVKAFLLYALPALIVPIAYILVLTLHNHQEPTISNVLKFMLYDFYQEDVVNASYSWNGWKSVLFQAVNTVRMFFQVHPNVYVLLKGNILYFIPLTVSLFIGVKLAWQFLKLKNVFRKRENNLALFANIHLFIFIITYLFAFYSYGNIEFLVALPFVLLLYLGIKFHVDTLFLKRFVLLLFVWNFSFGIFPDYQYSYYNDEELVDYIIQNPTKNFLVKNPDIGNQYFYKTGINVPKNVLYYHKVSSDSLQVILKETDIYTDVIGKPEVFNRSKIAAIGNKSLVLNSPTKEEVLSFEGLYGVSKVYRIPKTKE